MKKTIFSLLSLAALTSCSPNFYQMYEVQAEGMTEKQNSIVYDNADCTLSYSLWGDSGDMDFVFTNKTDKDIYLLMDKSFFIRNGLAKDYYIEKEVTKTETQSFETSDSHGATLFGLVTAYGKWYPATVNRTVNNTAKKMFSKGVSVKEPRTICVPAKSFKVIGSFNISTYVYLECESSKLSFPSKMAEGSKYDKSSSPLTFRNRIAYAFSEEEKNPKYVDNEFWVKSYSNYTEKAFLTKEKLTYCTGAISPSFSYFYNYEAANRFYNVYTKKTFRGYKPRKAKASRSSNSRNYPY